MFFSGKKSQKDSHNDSSHVSIIEQIFIRENKEFLHNIEQKGRSGIVLRQHILDNTVDVTTKIVRNRITELKSIINNAEVILPSLQSELIQKFDIEKENKYDLVKESKSLKDIYKYIKDLFNDSKGVNS